MVIPPHGQTRSSEKKKITVQYVGEVQESTAVLTGSIKREKKIPIELQLKEMQYHRRKLEGFYFCND